MNRRSFVGACAALLTVPVAALASQSVPRFIVDAANRCRFHFSPFDEWNWIDMPSPIVDMFEYQKDLLIIRCVGGNYALSCAGTPEQDWFITDIAGA